MDPKPNEKATLCVLVLDTCKERNVNGCMCDVSPRVGSMRTRSDKASCTRAADTTRRETSRDGVPRTVPITFSPTLK